jgi:hypothetical protein
MKRDILLEETPNLQDYDRMEYKLFNAAFEKRVVVAKTSCFEFLMLYRRKRRCQD